MVLTQRLIATAALVFALCAGTSCDSGADGGKSAGAKRDIDSFIASGKAAKDNAKFADALVAYQHALALADKASTPGPWATAATGVAQMHDNLGNWKEAEQLYRDVIQLREERYGKESEMTSIALNNFATFLHARDRLAEAEPLMRRALTIAESVYGNDDPYVAKGVSNLAQLLKDTGRLEEAELLMRRALDIDEKAHGEDQSAVGRDLNNLAQFLNNTGRLAEAEPLMRRALGILETSHGTNHPSVAVGLNNLAQVLRNTDRPAEAEPLMRRALAIDEACYGKNHPNVAIDLNNLALFFQNTNRLAEAEPLLQRMVEIHVDFTMATGNRHPAMDRVIDNFRVLRMEMGDTEEQAGEKLARILAPIRKK